MRFKIIALYLFCFIGLMLHGCASTTTNTTTTNTTTTTTGGATTTSSTSSTTRTTTPMPADPTAKPTSTVKLIFMHHSNGDNWLGDDWGGLGISLRDNNYFVSDTNYNWSTAAGDIGNSTDIGQWYSWFLGTYASTHTAALYTESSQHPIIRTYSRLATDPGGENKIIMFKSCYPNCNLRGNATDPATSGTNALAGVGWNDDGNHPDNAMTVGNAKGIYNSLLTYFHEHQDKLFIIVTAPPLLAYGTVDEGHYYTAAYADNARAFNNWLVNDWLTGYGHYNVAVFDFFNVLTDLNNHHRYNSGVEHVTVAGSGNVEYYPASAGDAHANAVGEAKATTEFVPLLNYYYNRWRANP